MEQEIKLTLTKERETKGTWLYREPDGSDMVIRNIYISKTGVDVLGKPDEIEVIIRPSKVASLGEG